MVGASFRLLAASADQEQAKAFLEYCGFTGLKYKAEGDDRIAFTYSDVDLSTLKQRLGPMTKNASGAVSGKVGTLGSLFYWPAMKRVALRNSKRGAPNVPPVKAPTPAPKLVVDPIKTGNENDDNNAPVTHISEVTHQAYLKAQKTTDKKVRLMFMRDLWRELAATKFGGRMKTPPYLGLMKEQGASRMRTRGIWYASKRMIKISPRMFNASQNFFVEVFLHEMCHQATSELSIMNDAEAADNRKHMGHGRVWASWMRQVGLNPLRYDPNENSTYMTEEEREEHEQKKQKWQQTKKDVEDQRLRSARMIYGEQVIVRRPTGLEKGVVVCTTGKTTDRWAILKLRDVEAGTSPYSNFSWFLNSSKDVYADPSSHKNWSALENFERLARAVRDQYERKALRREAKKVQRRNMFGLW